MEKDPITKEVLFFLTKKGRASQQEITDHIKNLKLDDMYISKTLRSLTFLKYGDTPKIIDEWRILK